ncbi:MAG: ribose 5-phosphate isomerase B [Oscillospiraceae bacterium]|nr:ribose 5-phosphate isomerase B [Oscillospiraceae bacterium]
MSIKIALGSDHAGFELRGEVAAYLEKGGFEYTILGCREGESCDYPLVAREVCALITEKKADLGILICGTGIGISIAANKIKGIRAALCTDTFMAKHSRLHNNANVLCLGGRVSGSGVALEITEAFLTNEFKGGRHQRRVELLEPC